MILPPHQPLHTYIESLGTLDEFASSVCRQLVTWSLLLSSSKVLWCQWYVGVVQSMFTIMFWKAVVLAGYMFHASSQILARMVLVFKRASASRIVAMKSSHFVTASSLASLSCKNESQLQQVESFQHQSQSSLTTPSWLRLIMDSVRTYRVLAVLSSASPNSCY